MNLDQVRTFVDTAEKKGYMTASVAKQTRTGLEKISKIAKEDNGQADVGDPSKVDAYFSRFLTRHSEELSSESANVYASRVKKAVENCKSYHADPLKYKPTFGTKKRVSKSDSKRSKKEDVSPSANTNSNPSPDSIIQTFETVYPLRAEYMMPLSLPRDLKVDEVRRLSYYLLTLCKDFNPGKTPDIWQHPAPEEQKQLPKH